MLVGPEQLRDERRGHQRVKVHVQPVERPAQPRRDARAPLLARNLAQMRHLSRRRTRVGGVHALGLENDGDIAPHASAKKMARRSMDGANGRCQPAFPGHGQVGM